MRTKIYENSANEYFYRSTVTFPCCSDFFVFALYRVCICVTSCKMKPRWHMDKCFTGLPLHSPHVQIFCICIYIVIVFVLHHDLGEIWIYPYHIYVFYRSTVTFPSCSVSTQISSTPDSVCVKIKLKPLPGWNPHHIAISCEQQVAGKVKIKSTAAVFRFGRNCGEKTKQSGVGCKLVQVRSCIPGPGDHNWNFPCTSSLPLVFPYSTTIRLSSFLCSCILGPGEP